MFHDSFQAEDIPKALVVVHISEHNDEDWHPNSGATAHITNSSINLLQLIAYYGSDGELLWGVENPFPLHISGLALLEIIIVHCPHGLLLLFPIKKNLLSISQLTNDYPCYFVFTHSAFSIKDTRMHRMLILGKTDPGLYNIRGLQAQISFSERQRQVNERVWHRRLGHPNDRVLQHLRSVKLISINRSSSDLCSSCDMSKSTKLTF